MSNDKDDGYEPVVGFSVPIKRVLGHDERPENPDGSRTGSLFMTLEGCTFKDGSLKGSAAATVGAPSVVVEVVERGHRDCLTESKSSSRYIVSAHDIVQVAINAHKARMSSDHVRCRYSDCSEHHPVATEDEQVTCATCREVLGLPPKAADSGTAVTLRRLARLVWLEVGRARNPLLSQTISSGMNDHRVNENFAAWNATQVELGRALFHVVFNNGTPDLGLIERALDFIAT